MDFFSLFTCGIVHNAFPNANSGRNCDYLSVCECKWIQFKIEFKMIYPNLIIIIINIVISLLYSIHGIIATDFEFSQDK